MRGVDGPGLVDVMVDADGSPAVALVGEATLFEPVRDLLHGHGPTGLGQHLEDCVADVVPGQRDEGIGRHDVERRTGQ